VKKAGGKTAAATVVVLVRCICKYVPTLREREREAASLLLQRLVGF